jgi:hypothetical protein
MGVIRTPLGVNSLAAAPRPTAAATANIQAVPVTRPANQLAGEIETRARAIANEMIAVMSRQQQQASSGRVFTRFDAASDIIENQKTFVTTGLFTGNAATMSMAYSSSAQSTASKVYYYDMLSANPALSTSEVQFAVAHGHRLGSGSSAAGTLNDSPARAVYSQYRLLLLNPGDTTFTFGGGQSSDSIYAMNFNRARIKDKLDPGNWQLSLTNLNGNSFTNNTHTGSNVTPLNTNIISLIDDSGQGQETNLTTGGRVFNIVSGSITGGVFSSTAPKYYGLAYPDMGILILNGNALDVSMSFNTVSGSNVAGDNAWKLFTSISGALAYGTQYSLPNLAFAARNEETVTSTHFFVRVKNGEYNFSNNPTFVTGSVGELQQPTFIGDPKTYITSIGMYNDRQELLAVAKLSKPIQKSFSNEALIKVKLDF